ncbi:RES family NAD+ phosphorylase [Methylotuvimicrobium sp. KM2]|uniref:RES family NAD+ phosphorylase n=1 Tax=Methylotuvimicrobium sp. KM2 TaxID=3133976 RepID=UPI0031013F11
MSGVKSYRIVKQKWADSAFDGEGAKRYGGRWNSRGKPCVYLAGSESLAILEILVHLDKQQFLTHYALFELHLPKQDVVYLDAEKLPACWRDEPAPPETAAIGDAWLFEGSELALAAPSVIVPREWNFIVNPKHPAFAGVVKRARRLDFEPDKRLFSS